MPKDHKCSLTIPANSNRGGRLVGSGFGAGNPPSLNAQDTLTVEVKWAGPSSSAPSSLTGYFVFSASPLAGSNQAAPSPFMSGANYVCFMVQVASVSQGPGSTQYTFTPVQYQGNQAGRYELTFVAQLGDPTSPTQWSEDPEFDTSN